MRQYHCGTAFFDSYANLKSEACRKEPCLTVCKFVWVTRPYPVAFLVRRTGRLTCMRPSKKTGCLVRETACLQCVSIINRCDVELI